MSATRNISNVFARSSGVPRQQSSRSIINTASSASALFEPGTGRAVYAGVKARC